jgi:hypothetical protein
MKKITNGRGDLEIDGVGGGFVEPDVPNKRFFFQSGVTLLLSRDLLC